MIKLSDFITNFPLRNSSLIDVQPWNLIRDLKELIEESMKNLGSDFHIENGLAIHKSAEIERGVTLKPPVIISANCKVGANAYFREGVFLAHSVKIGQGSELKSSIICDQSAIAHMNYIGNSIIGSRVNFEAGSIAANHFNEREVKNIKVIYKGEIEDTGLTKFGSLVGDDSKIGANAVLSPGSILEKSSVVRRLELVEQVRTK